MEQPNSPNLNTAGSSGPKPVTPPNLQANKPNAVNPASETAPKVNNQTTPAPSLDSKQTSANPDLVNPTIPPVQLAPEPMVFKTMPKKFSAEKFQPAMPSHRSSGPELKIEKSSGESASVMTPVRDSDSILGDYSSAPSRPWLKIVGIVVAVLIVAAAGYFAYTKFFANNTEDQSPVDTNQNQQTNNQNNSVPTPASQLSQEWVSQYFANCTDQQVCGDNADPDKDGLINTQEQTLGLDPNNPDSDSDGLADGDEVNIFGFNPSSLHTSSNFKYSDTVDAKDKWNANQKRLFSAQELADIAGKVKQYGFHAPTISTLGAPLIDAYTNFKLDQQNPNLQSTNNAGQNVLPASSESSASALDRDVQRAEAIKKISYALLKYKTANSAYPNTSSFDQMISDIQPLLVSTAVNTTDPINNQPYVYTYSALSKGADFALGYYSETQKQQIVIKTADAQKNQAKDQVIQRDVQRRTDVELIAGALELYATDIENADPGQRKYPVQNKWKSEIQKYMTSIPVDPQTSKDYVYTVSDDFMSFALQSTFESPPTGKKGYFCDQDTCGYY